MVGIGLIGHISNMTSSTKKPAIAPNNIKSLRKARGITLEQLGQDVGTDASTISKMEKGAMRLSDRWIGPIADALGVSVGDLFSRTVDSGETVTTIRSDVREAAVKVPSLQSMPADLPVLGTAAGSHLRGAFQLETDSVIEYIRRPPGLMTAVNAYALYVDGTSMVPEHNHGDLRIVHPGRPARPGDSVIVQVKIAEHAPVEATIGHFRKKTATSVVIGKLNPPADIELKLDTVIAVHKVLTMNELFGV